MSRSLLTWHHEQQVGELFITDGRWGFTYTTNWLNHTKAFSLSPWFPLNKNPIVDTTDNRTVE